MDNRIMADYDVLKTVAKEKKFDLDQLINMYVAESSGRSDVVNPKGYVGGFQFGTMAGEEYGLVGEGFDYRKDLKKSASAAIDMYRANIRDEVKNKKSTWSLSKVFKEHEITPDLAGYLTHQQGRFGFIDIITGAKSGNISAETRKNMLENVGSKDLSGLGDKELANKFINFWKGRYEEKTKEAVRWKARKEPREEAYMDMWTKEDNPLA